MGAGVGREVGSGSGTGRDRERDRVGGGGGCSSKKICVSGFGQTHGRGGPAESHREYYEGEGFSGDPTRHGGVGFPRDGAAAGELIGAYGSRLIRLVVRVRPEGFCVFFGWVGLSRGGGPPGDATMFLSPDTGRGPQRSRQREENYASPSPAGMVGGCLFGSVPDSSAARRDEKLVMRIAGGGAHRGDVMDFHVGAKLRRVGPIAVASAC